VEESGDCSHTSSCRTTLENPLIKTNWPRGTISTRRARAQAPWMDHIPLPKLCYRERHHPLPLSPAYQP
jgi:hypothetical protein